jgi:hypothetical protein
MEYLLNLALKVLFIISTHNTDFFLEIRPCAKKVIFVSEFVILFKNSPFYEVKIIV